MFQLRFLKQIIFGLEISLMLIFNQFRKYYTSSLDSYSNLDVFKSLAEQGLS